MSKIIADSNDPKSPCYLCGSQRCYPEHCGAIHPELVDQIVPRVRQFSLLRVKVKILKKFGFTRCDRRNYHKCITSSAIMTISNDKIIETESIEEFCELLGKMHQVFAIQYGHMETAARIYGRN